MENKQIVEENSFDAILGKDVVNKLLEKTGVNLTKEELKRLEKEAVGSVDFIKAIENVEIPKDNYVVFTDGDIQLLYENGEFFIISTMDSPKRRKKTTKKEATDMYLNYFIKYQLNPILDARDKNMEKTQKVVEKPVKAKAPKAPKKEVEKEVKEEVLEVEEKVKPQREEKEIEL